MQRHYEVLMTGKDEEGVRIFKINSIIGNTRIESIREVRPSEVFFFFMGILSVTPDDELFLDCFVDGNQILFGKIRIIDLIIKFVSKYSDGDSDA